MNAEHITVVYKWTAKPGKLDELTSIYRDVTRAMVRDAHEQLEITADDYVELGMEGFTPPIQITCEDHGGGGLVAVAQWDSRLRKWQQITEFNPPNDALIEPQIEAASAAFAESRGITPAGC